MIRRGVFLLTVLSTCVLSLPVTSSQLENEDVEVMKCVVEALADVLSRPRLMPISQECLVTLKTDDRLLTILRHHNFLKELQEIAVQGGHRRAALQKYTESPTPTSKTLHTLDRVADRSMLDALGGPGERSILSQRKREEDDESSEDGESHEDSGAEEVEAKRRKEDANNHGGHKKTRTNSEENSKEESEVKDTRGDGSDETSVTSRNKSTKGSLEVQDKAESGKRSALRSQKPDSKEEEEEEEEEEDKKKRGGKENIKRWTKRTKSSHVKKKAVQKEEQQFSSQQEVPHHSKEVTDEEEEEEKRGTQRSPEEKELQLIAHGAQEDKKKGMEDEGSGIRKEEPEIESLAAIESELENVAQKLHDLRRG